MVPLNLLMEDGIISIYYAEKSIKNTAIGYCSQTIPYLSNMLELCDTVNSQLKLCRESYVGRTV